MIKEQIFMEIAKRAENKNMLAFDKISLIMDLTAVDEEVGLRYEELLKADDFNFAHDIVGIQNNLNRRTKKLENLFLPRYSK